MPSAQLMPRALSDPDLLVNYGTIILCFMAGVLWGFAAKARAAEIVAGVDFGLSMACVNTHNAAARIARLYYGAADPKSGGVAQGPRVFDHPQAHHRPEIYAGMGEDEAAALLRDFFAARR